MYRSFTFIHLVERFIQSEEQLSTVRDLGVSVSTNSIN